MAFIRLGDRTAVMARAIANGGRASMTSVKRITIVSIQPPKYPATRPRITPKGTATPKTPITKPRDTR